MSSPQALAGDLARPLGTPGDKRPGSVPPDPLRQAAWLVRGCLIGIVVATLAQLAMMLMPPFPSGLPAHTSMLSLHLLLELFAVVIAVLIATVSWHTFSAHDRGQAQLLIAGFSAVAVCDVVHALTYAGMPPLLGEASTPRAIFFWLMGRSVEIGVLALVALGFRTTLSRNAALGLGLGLAALLVWWGSAGLAWFPTVFVPGQGVTPFKAGYEVVLCAVALAVSVALWRRARREVDELQARRLVILATSAWIIGIGELSFTTYVTPSDFHNIFGHSFKIAGYALLYWATFIGSLRAPFEALRRTELRASEGEARLRTLSDNLPGSVVYQVLALPDGARRFTHIGRAVRALTGLSAEQVLTEADALYRRVHPDDREGLVRSEALALTGAADYQHELRLLHLDGSVRLVDLRSRPRRLSGGVTAWDGVMTDITAQRRAEDARREHEARLAAVIDAASDAIISTDLSGRIALFNPAAERIFGHPAAQMLGQPLDRLLPPAARAAHGGELRRFAASGTSTRSMAAGRVPGLRADGTPLALEASISQVTVNGQQVLTAILRDVTERVRTERALVQTQLELTALTQQLMQQEKTTNQQLAQALHDQLGQTLTALRLDHVSEAGFADPQQQARHARVDRLIDQAIREVRQVLVDLRPTLLDEAGLFEALDNELRRRQASAPGVKLQLQVPAALQARRWPGEVEYVVFMVAREAVGNALQHAQPATVTVSLEGGADTLELQVRDDGRGLPADAHLPRPGHLGVVGMRERSIAIGARFALQAGPAGGTAVSLHWQASSASAP